MAGAGLLMLLDDIATLLDDVALMTKTAAGKSTAILDDVATQTSDWNAQREAVGEPAAPTNTATARAPEIRAALITSMLRD